MIKVTFIEIDWSHFHTPTANLKLKHSVLKKNQSPQGGSGGFGAQRIKVIKNDSAEMNKVAPKTYIVPSFTGVAVPSRKAS